MLATKGGGVFVSGQLQVLLAQFPFIMWWILCGFFNWRFVLLFLVGLEVTQLVTYLSYYAFRISPRDFGYSFTLRGAEFGVTYPHIAPYFLPAAGLLLFGGYFVASTYVYVSHPLHSLEALHGILAVSMPLSLGGFLLLGPFLLLEIASPRISDKTRRALFASVASSAFPLGVLLIFYITLIGLRLDGLVPAWARLPSQYARYSPWLPLPVLTIAYLLILVVPYFVGLEGRRRNESETYAAAMKRLTHVLDAVGLPSVKDVEQLTALKASLQADAAALADEEPIIRLRQLVLDANEADVNPNMVLVMEAFRHFQDQDLRLVNYDSMLELEKKLDEMIAEYQRVGADPRFPTYIDLGRAFLDYFRQERSRCEEQQKAAEARSVLAPVLGRMIAVFGAAPVVYRYAQEIVKLLPIAR
jgi:hypothetical protein